MIKSHKTTTSVRVQIKVLPKYELYHVFMYMAL